MQANFPETRIRQHLKPSAASSVEAWRLHPASLRGALTGNQKGLHVSADFIMTDARELNHALNPGAGLETRVVSARTVRICPDSEDAALPLGDFPNWQQENGCLSRLQTLLNFAGAWKLGAAEAADMPDLSMRRIWAELLTVHGSEISEVPGGLFSTDLLSVGADLPAVQSTTWPGPSSKHRDAATRRDAPRRRARALAWSFISVFTTARPMCLGPGSAML